MALTLISKTGFDAPAPISFTRIPEAAPINFAWSVSIRPIQSRAAISPPDTELENRIRIVESLILGLAENRPLEEMRPQILALYPELGPDFKPNWASQHPNKIRAAAHRYRLRLELIEAVLSEHAALMIWDRNSD